MGSKANVAKAMEKKKKGSKVMIKPSMMGKMKK